MTPQDPDRIRRDLPADLDPVEAERMVALGQRLGSERPLPAPGFRGDLRRRLAAAPAGSTASPRRIRALAVSCALSGLVLLAIGAAGVAGGGPFAA